MKKKKKRSDRKKGIFRKIDILLSIIEHI